MNSIRSANLLVRSNNNKTVSKIFLAILINDALEYMSWTQSTSNLFILQISLKYFAFYLLLSTSNKVILREKVDVKFLNYFRLFIGWNIISILIGILTSSAYWDFKMIGNITLPYLLVPMVIYWGSNLEYIKSFFSFVLKYLFPFGFLLIPLGMVTNDELYARLMNPIYSFILFIPFLNKKYKYLVVLVVIFSILSCLDFRTGIIKLSFSILLLLASFFENYVRVGLYKFIIILFLCLPPFLLVLGVLNIFNIFASNDDKEKYTVQGAQGEESSLVADTRTFLYVEVFNSMKKRNSFLFGEGAAGKYETQTFTQITSYDDNQRESCEVGILNILLWTGIIGVLLTAAVIFVGSYVSIVYSNNYFCRTLGVFLMFHWVMLFVEEFSFFDLNNLFYWLIFGMAMSNKFRRMNNREIKNFFSQIVAQDNFKFISNKRHSIKPIF